GARVGAWCAKHNNRYQWLQVDFGRPTRITKISTQGRQDYPQWVTQYYLSYAQDGVFFTEYKINSARKIFRGNYERFHVVYNRLFRPIKARYVRIHPYSWQSYIAMRVELYGCRLGKMCNQPMGMNSGKIRNNRITASSKWDNNHAPFLARLKHSRKGRFMGAWSAKHNNHYQWLQVDLTRTGRVIRVSTQGRQDNDQWVTSYYLLYSQNGVNFRHVMYNSNIKTFQANRDRNTVVAHVINPSIIARFVRFHPRGWRSHISMRIELFGCLIDKCKTPAGFEDRRVRSGQLRASSSYNYNHGPDRARINQRNTNGRTGAWVARLRNRHQWLQFDATGMTRFTGIATQGRYEANQWVTSYTLKFGNDGRPINAFQDKDVSDMQVFRGNYDRYIVVKHAFVRPITARYLRVHPLKWRSWISMRVELYGCVVGPRCNKALGMSTGRINSKAVTASSKWDANHGPWLARLNLARAGARMGGWSAKINNRLQWLLVDLGGPRKVTRVATQGRSDNNQWWVKKYKLAFSFNGFEFADYKESGSVKVFAANSDRHTVVHHDLIRPVRALYVRVNPRQWYGWISMRVEFFG
ncbi:predicted protein, partial [Nematostella vectensis]